MRKNRPPSSRHHLLLGVREPRRRRVVERRLVAHQPLGAQRVVKGRALAAAKRLGVRTAQVVDDLARIGVLGGVPASRLYPGKFEDLLIVAATETNTDGDLVAFEKALRGVL